MTTPTPGIGRPFRGPSPTATPENGHTHSSPDTSHGAPGSHRWMMMICCIPMVVIVVLLVASGAAGSGTVLWALGCVAMMAAMMFMMPGGHNHK
jgi:hypothetical protein